MAKIEKDKTVFNRKYLLGLGIPMIMIPGLLLAIRLGMINNIEQLTGYYMIESVFPKSAVVSEVIDGDTIVATSGATIRLLGMNAPDRGKDGYVESKNRLSEMILGKEVWIEYDGYLGDMFGRALGWVWVGCEGLPKFLPHDYMKKFKNNDPDLFDNPDGCLEGKLVNEEIVKIGAGEVIFYKGRGKMKYQARMEKIVTR